MNEKIQHEKCIAACGFFANGDKNGYCSFCWKTMVMNTSSSQQQNEVTTKSETIKKSQDNDKCQMCSKRIGFLGFSCKCGKRFCGLHRHAETHMCGTDFKTDSRLQLEQKLCVVKPNKINKI